MALGIIIILLLVIIALMIVRRPRLTEAEFAARRKNNRGFALFIGAIVGAFVAIYAVVSVVERYL